MSKLSNSRGFGTLEFLAIFGAVVVLGIKNKERQLEIKQKIRSLKYDTNHRLKTIESRADLQRAEQQTFIRSFEKFAEKHGENIDSIKVGVEGHTHELRKYIEKQKKGCDVPRITVCYDEDGFSRVEEDLQDQNGGDTVLKCESELYQKADYREVF